MGCVRKLGVSLSWVRLRVGGGDESLCVHESDVSMSQKFARFGSALYFLTNYSQGWALNFKNVAPQKQNAICKLTTQYAKRNCAFKPFKAHCAATINAKNASFHKKFVNAIQGENKSSLDSIFDHQNTKHGI